MEIEINWLAVALATASAMLVGSVWYAKPVFGKRWIKLAKVDEKKMNSGEGFARIMGITVVMAFLEAFVIAHVADMSREFFAISTVSASLQTAFWLWLGISLTTTVVHDLFERRPGQLTLLTIGNQFVTLMLMGLIIGLVGGF
jgi:hypothetical protein